METVIWIIFDKSVEVARQKTKNLKLQQNRFYDEISRCLWQCRLSSNSILNRRAKDQTKVGAVPDRLCDKTNKATGYDKQKMTGRRCMSCIVYPFNINNKTAKHISTQKSYKLSVIYTNFQVSKSVCSLFFGRLLGRCLPVNTYLHHGEQKT